MDHETIRKEPAFYDALRALERLEGDVASAMTLAKEKYSTEELLGALEWISKEAEIICKSIADHIDNGRALQVMYENQEKYFATDSL